MSTPAPNEARVIPLRPAAQPPGSEGAPRVPQRPRGTPPAPRPREPLWRHLVGGALRRERLAQERTLKDVAQAARISMPYLSELERGRKEASSEVLAAAAQALGLGLGDLLSLAQDELAQHSRGRVVRDRVVRDRVVRDRERTAPTARYDGLCLVA
ncbi:helix-turn-helix domain-containing protein [Streptacidiphilus sp. P02-A3a]|uniref:helix-turn-helix domain-containing protein n=1 Tax=Streptacidiphilus sp. P02-A3a TaxID=2704468 RepID=UPI0015FA6DF1|nr:helix-turn-helix domain-containing protein [Streptacidiphilus sp. P02-A3a]QMU70154.1 helix-turn-helix domain-containing protein [Streptacidiphilus sp. P02-A3a]QMU70396.1 helix-turn-helix domain-containing protein [Streptacidiphilus sp. P02-A3a]